MNGWTSHVPKDPKSSNRTAAEPIKAQKQAAYRADLKARGLVQVVVFVPEDRKTDLRNYAASLRDAGQTSSKIK